MSVEFSRMDFPTEGEATLLALFVRTKIQKDKKILASKIKSPAGKRALADHISGKRKLYA